MLAQRLVAQERPQRIYASPLRRTCMTAEPAARALSLEVQMLPGVIEYNFGMLSGLTWREIAERDPEVIAGLRARTPAYPAYPGEEGRGVFQDRVCTSIWGLTECCDPGDRVAIFTHAGPIVVFCISVLGLPYQRPAPFAAANASITTLDLDGAQGVIVATNDTCHLAPLQRSSPPST